MKSPYARLDGGRKSYDLLNAVKEGMGAALFWEPDIDLIWDHRDSLYSIIVLLVMPSFIRQEFAPA